MSRLAYALATATATILLMGCSGEKLPDIGQFEGVVKVKGQPKSSISIRFIPDSAKGNDLPVSVSATSDDKGAYHPRYVYKGKEGDGATVGWYRVVLQDLRLLSVQQGGPVPPRLFPVAYSSPSDTPLSIEVKPGTQTIDLVVP